MLDGGCLYKQYASDMTRFWPIDGRFSAPYQLLYDILLTVQKELIEYLNSGERNIAREKLNMLSDELLIKYLREEMILSRTIDKYQAKRIIDYLSPTGVSHHLGLDVHDCEALAFSESLQPGNVITIEPGSICFVFFVLISIDLFLQVSTFLGNVRIFLRSIMVLLLVLKMIF